MSGEGLSRQGIPRSREAAAVADVVTTKALPPGTFCP
jgi:hypothetical protein